MNPYSKRRTELKKLMEEKSGIIVFMANNQVGINYKANTYKYRPNSHILYFTGIHMPDIGIIIDIDSGNTTLYADNQSLSDIIWEGYSVNVEAWAHRAGIELISPKSDFSKAIDAATKSKRQVHYTPPYRAEITHKMAELCNKTYQEIKDNPSISLIKAIVELRSIKEDSEIQNLDQAVTVSQLMHVEAMSNTNPDHSEASLTSLVQALSTTLANGTAYPVILSTDGQILHNHLHRKETLGAGRLILGDFGAQSQGYYAGDLTRTWPVDGKFTQQQKEIYDIVLAAQENAILACRPNVKFKSIHLKTARIIGEGLKALGLMKGNIEEAVKLGATALFFPHGLGHMIGLDVHDMEDLGENYVGYDESTFRSNQFGLAYLRLGKALKTNNVITVEPGIYFISNLIEQWQSEGKFIDFINYNKVNDYLGFGGIRIEDDVVITNDKPKILGNPANQFKTTEQIEALMYQ